MCPSSQSFGSQSQQQYLDSQRAQTRPHSQSQQTQNRSQPQNPEQTRSNNPARRGLNAVYTDHAPDASSDHFSTDEVAEDGFIVQGKVNNIDTDVIIDSGAKISLLSSNFVPTDSVPISHASIRGVSQHP